MAKEKEQPKKVSRREFVKGAAVGAAGVAAAGALASCAPAATPAATTAPVATATAVPASAPTPVPEKWDYETDVVVVGSGNGGLSAGIRAAQEGAKVVLVEISSTTGGGSSYSGGLIHASGLKTVDDYMKYTQGLHDPELGPVYVEEFQKYKQWLVEIGADVCPSPVIPGELHMGQGPTLVPGQGPTWDRDYFDSLERIFADAGGTLLLKTRALKLLTDEAGMIVGLRAKGPEGTLNIKGKAVILACGGFQNNPELRHRYLGPEADLASVLGTPYNMGDGMRMALEVGAALSGGMSTFSGSFGPTRPFRNPQENPEEYEAAPYAAPGKHDYIRFTLLTPGTKILVNLNGKRYIDESAPYAYPESVTARQPQATGVAIFDEAMFAPIKDVVSLWHGFTAQETHDHVVEHGGVVLKADMIGELADKLAGLATPVHKANLLKTIEEYNEAVDAGTAAELEVARAGGATKLETPPFYGVPLTPWIYITYGGVRINKNAQVLDTQQEVIPRLYAVPPTAGGIMRHIYSGAIGCAGTFGWIAAKHAAAL